jgi:hypothetical protein
MSGKRFLSGAAPKIPLPGCDVLDCKCRFIHHKDRREGFGDFCSSAAWFAGWGRPRELVFGLGSAPSATLDDAPVVSPRTWLLRVGAARAGPLDPDDAPLSAPRR